MASRKWWSKRSWPVASKSETSSVSSRVTKSSKRGRSTTSGLFVSSRRSQSLPRSSSSTPLRILSRPYQPRDLVSSQSPAQNPLLPHAVIQPRYSVDEASEQLEDDSLNEIVLALDVKGQVGRGSACRVGACYYVACEEKLYLLPDTQSNGLDIIEAIRLHAQPTTILLPSRVDEEVDRTLDPRENEDSPLSYVLDIRPSPEFDYASGKQKLTDLRIASQSSVRLIVPGHRDTYESYMQGLDHGFTSRQDKLLKLSTMVDFESTLSIGCAGAVLSCLQRRRAETHLPSDQDGERFMKVSFVETTTLKGFMHVTIDTLSALQIVQLQPQLCAQPQSTRDDLSVHRLFHSHAKTPQGRSLLRQYFLRPSANLEVIHERHAAISTFLAPDNESKMDEMVKHLKSVKDMRPAMLHLQKGQSCGIKNGVWTVLRSFTYYALAIRASIAQVLDNRRVLIITKILERFQIHELATIGRLIVQIVDFQKSQQQQRTVVNAGVDEELDELKRMYDGLEDLLGETSRAIAATVPQHFAIELSVVFLPQIGFLICMPKDLDTQRSIWEGGPGQEAWERIFTTDEHAFYKDYRMQEMDERIGDLHAAVCDKEIEIVHELAQRVLEYEATLCSVSEICGELDALLALAQGARLHKLTRPRMTPDNIVEVHEGRHLLQQQTVPICITNDTLLVGGEGTEPSAPNRPEYGAMPPPPRPSVPKEGPSMLVLTGPNYSGKSIYLKQVALIVYLAHVGSFVPATRATIGLTDRILTRIATRESVARPQSAFAIDLQQVCTALRTATRQSLVLLDEFGKGTAVSDGAGLLCGTLEHLLSRPRQEQAKVLAATHFHELFEDRSLEDASCSSDSSCAGSDHPSRAMLGSFFPSRPGLAFGHMEVLINKAATDATDQVTYLYKLQPGRSLASLGMICAALNGIDAAVVARAEELVVLEANGGDLVAACAGSGETAEDLEDLEQAEAVARAFLSTDLEVDEWCKSSDPDPWRRLLTELV